MRIESNFDRPIYDSGGAMPPPASLASQPVDSESLVCESAAPGPLLYESQLLASQAPHSPSTASLASNPMAAVLLGQGPLASGSPGFAGPGLGVPGLGVPGLELPFSGSSSGSMCGPVNVPNAPAPVRAPAAHSSRPSHPPDPSLESQSSLRAEAMLTRVIPSALLPMFHAIERANEAAETAGHGAVPSRLITTAGAGSPASFGRSQLLVSLQVEGLREIARTPAGLARIESFGVGRADLESIHTRGRAAQQWYGAVVNGRHGQGVNDGCSLSRADAGEIRMLARRGDVDGIVARYGARFERETGIPAQELGAMALTTRLLDRGVQHEFRSLHRAYRGNGGDSAALDALVRSHPELGQLRERMRSASGDDRSLAFFLQRPRRNGEHRAAWYTRAARVDQPAYDRLIGALTAGADQLTSRARQVRNFMSATGVLTRAAGFDALPESRRALLVGQLSRIRHGHPAYFEQTFGSARAPRLETVQAVEQALRGMLEASSDTTAGDQGRSIRAFTQRFEQAQAGASAPG